MVRKIGFGLLAGVIATAAMDASQTTLIPAISSWIASRRGAQLDRGSSDETGTNSAPESSPEKVAHRGADLVGVTLSRDEISTWGARVHWIYGAHWGSVFSTLGVPRSLRGGITYGALLWIGSDELLLWALGIADKPTAYGLPVHVKALAAHLIYGGVLGVTLAGLEPRRPI